MDLWLETFNSSETNVAVEGRTGTSCTFNNFFPSVGFECFNNAILHIRAALRN